MGFGKDKVNGSYKVVRMFYDPNIYCEILDMDIGVWRKSNPPPYVVDARRKSACVNGSIYWLELVANFTILALDLHTEEFRNVRPPPKCYFSDQVLNFEDRLAVATTHSERGWKLEIRCLDAQEKLWSLTHYISLVQVASPGSWEVWFRPVAVSKKGNVFFYDNDKKLFKYYPKTRRILCLSRDIHVIAPFVENLVPLPRPSLTSGYQSGFRYLEHASSFRIPKIFRRIKSQTPNILVTTTFVSLVMFGVFVVRSKS